MSEGSSIFQSGFADRVDAVSARIRRHHWSRRQLLTALAAGPSLILVGLFGNFSGRLVPSEASVSYR